MKSCFFEKDKSCPATNPKIQFCQNCSIRRDDIVAINSNGIAYTYVANDGIYFLHSNNKWSFSPFPQETAVQTDDPFPSRHGESWTPFESENLHDAFDEFCVKKARQFGRTSAAVRWTVRKMLRDRKDWNM